jgi:hypothetical protein
MTIQTQASLDEFVSRMGALCRSAGASIPGPCFDPTGDVRTSFIANTPRDAVRVPGLGDAAYSVTKPPRFHMGNYEVTTLSGTTVISLTFDQSEIVDLSPIPDVVQRLASVARAAIAGLG